VRVCVLGDVTEPLDEGMKKVTHALASALAEYCDVQILNPLSATKKRFWSSLSHSRPDIIHYVPGPSLRSFILLALAKTRTRAATVMSLTHPDPALPRRIACGLFRPDLLLAQSVRDEQLFRELGCNVRFMPNGVDTELFRPVPLAERMRLRLKYGVSGTAYVVLHVGNTRRVRNLDVLAALQQDGCQVVVVSSTTIQGDADLDRHLTDAGCLVWNRYIESVQEVYALADCYVFPTPTGVGAIEHPLSIMEAMACNLPVVTRRFGALPRLFEPGDGLYFVDTDEELRTIVNQLQEAEGAVATRARVLDMDWDVIASKVAVYYQDLMPKPSYSHARESGASRRM
jgi:glycosyltransferase involved in cell wall biosynthesis